MQGADAMGCSPSKMEDRVVGVDTAKFFRRFTDSLAATLRTTPHTNARESPYQGGGPPRSELDDSELSWDFRKPDYCPPLYNAPILCKNPPPFWADPRDARGIVHNSHDELRKYLRTSHEGPYDTNECNEPLNPHGRTGLGGSGLLGRWGPNHAADPVITKWRRDKDGNKMFDDKLDPILEFVAIKRNDTGDWAIPGGMVDPGEDVSMTLKREFGEETMAAMELSPDERQALMASLDSVFHTGDVIYRGYVDDIRNTDHAWMETTCVNYHDEEGNSLSKFKLTAGDDAGDVAWTPYHDGIKLYATHATFIETIWKMRVALHFHLEGKASGGGHTTACE